MLVHCWATVCDADTTLFQHWVTLPPTAVAAADTVLSKWWYLLAVVHRVLLCYYTLTPYTTKHLLCLDNAASLQMFYNHISSWNVLI